MFPWYSLVDRKVTILEVVQVPGKYFVLGSFFKMYFRRRPPDRQPSGENPRTHLEVQGPLGDEVTFQECRKSRKLKI